MRCELSELTFEDRILARSLRELLLEEPREFAAPLGMMAHDPTRGLLEAGIGRTEQRRHLLGLESSAGHLIDGDEGDSSRIGVVALQAFGRRNRVSDLDERVGEGVLLGSIRDFLGGLEK